MNSLDFSNGDNYKIIVSKLFLLIKSKINDGVSSISEDRFKEINESNIWIINKYLDKFSYLDKINLLVNEDIFDIYNEGLNVVRDKFLKAKLFYKTIFLNNMCDVSNYFYNSTLIDGLNIFFDKYDYNNRPLDYIITVDYDVFNYRSKNLGVDFIYDYMVNINYENVFCKKVMNDFIREVIFNYKDDLINIFEISFVLSILLIYLDKDVLEVKDFENFYNDIYLKENLLNSYDKLIEKYSFDKSVVDYVSKNKDTLINRIFILCENKCLNVILNRNEEINYYTNKSKNDNDFNNLVSYIKSKDFRINDVLLKVNSFIDLVEIINMNIFKKGELFYIFGRLNLVEIKLLKEMLSDDELINEFIDGKSKEETYFINGKYKINMIELD